VTPERIAELLQREQDRFVREHPRSAQLGARAARHFPGGVPMHWMSDWGTPFPLHVRSARGAELEDVDGHRYADFCLGDTGALYGHSPEPIARALAAQAGQGLTCMLPAERVAEVGELLAQRFGLPFWQITQSATDANRAVLRWARAITGRAKVLVFEGCYHGAVDETLVRRAPSGGRSAIPRPGLIGAPFDNASAARVVEFNDPEALERAFAHGDIACALAEPVMTNAGMVLPEPGFHAALRELTRRHGTLLAIDETHTLSTGLGGYTRVERLEPDFLVCGKAVAGGFPCAVFGFTAQVEQDMRRVLASRSGGHSGMGTTLSANALAAACLHAALAELQTAGNHERMNATAERLAAALQSALAARGLCWNVARVGARVELGFGAAPPRNGSESLAAMQPPLERALHLYALNRGLLLTPFHNMMLASPATTALQVDRLVTTLAEALDELRAD
jgi:glutamate-1-semialdehyde 2,1-aminomutase